MHREARDTVARHSLASERARFHAILGDVDRLWDEAKGRDAKAGGGPTGRPSRQAAEPEPDAAYRPLVGFMIVGAQRCGTSALAEFLSRHPEIAMSSQKEMHLFDGRNYSPDWTPEQIDARYRRGFQERDGVRLGDYIRA